MGAERSENGADSVRPRSGRSPVATTQPRKSLCAWEKRLSGLGDAESSRHQDSPRGILIGWLKGAGRRRDFKARCTCAWMLAWPQICFFPCGSYVTGPGGWLWGVEGTSSEHPHQLEHEEDGASEMPHGGPSGSQQSLRDPRGFVSVLLQRATPKPTPKIAKPSKAPRAKQCLQTDKAAPARGTCRSVPQEEPLE